MNAKGWAFLVGLLAVVAITWGSRETSWSKQVQTLTAENEQLRQQVTASQEKVVYKTVTVHDTTKTTETETPIVLPNGQVAYIKQTVVSAIEDSVNAMQSNFQSQIDELTTENLSLKQSKTVTEKKVTGPAVPLWNIVAEAPAGPGYIDVTNWRAGGGVNVGPLSLVLTNSVALQFTPRVELMLRL